MQLGLNAGLHIRISQDHARSLQPTRSLRRDATGAFMPTALMTLFAHPNVWAGVLAGRGLQSPIRSRRAGKLIEHILGLVHIAPDPGCRRHSAHHWMLRIMEMFSGMLAGRRIATADVTARSALAKSDPKSALGQALLAGVGSSRRRKILAFQAR